MTKRFTIQTCGSYNPDDEYSLTAVFNHFHAVTVYGLTKEDLQELQSCIECLLLEGPEIPNY
jgi:hypothetical protein